MADEKPAAEAGGGKARSRGRGSSRGSSPSSTGTGSSNPFGLEQDVFEPPAESDEPARLADELAAEPLELAPPEPIEWTPERAASVIRAGGFVLHAADPLGGEDGGEQLWRATDADCEAIGPPLARILNRYDAARRLAGLSDEGELAFGLLGYTKRNLALRGRLRSAQREQEAEKESLFEAGGTTGSPFGRPAQDAEPGSESAG